MGITGDALRDEAAGQEKIAGSGDVIAGFVPIIGEPEQGRMHEKESAEEQCVRGYEGKAAQVSSFSFLVSRETPLSFALS
jgi:hypothetical protein